MTAGSASIDFLWNLRGKSWKGLFNHISHKKKERLVNQRLIKGSFSLDAYRLVV